LLTLTAL